MPARLFIYCALLLFTIVSFGACRDTDSGTTVLKFRPVRGEIMHQQTTTDVCITQQVGDAWHGRRYESNLMLTYAIRDLLPDGSVLMQMTFDSTQFFLLDSIWKVRCRPVDTSGVISVMAVVYDLLVGESMTVRLGSNNHLQQILEFDALRKTLRAKAARYGLTDRFRGILETTLNGLNEQRFKGVLESGFARFPDQPVSIGDTWSYDKSDMSDVPFGLHITYTLLNIVGGRATIGLAAKSDRDSSTIPSDSGAGRSWHRAASDGFTGQIVIDVANGWGMAGDVVEDYDAQWALVDTTSSTILKKIWERRHIVLATKVWKD